MTNNRELKFRAWDGKEMRYWGFMKGCFISLPTESGGLNYPQMQFTGLRDKNGKEIYEGDIIRYFLYPKDTVWSTINTKEEGWELENGGWRLERRKEIQYRTDKGGFYPFGFHVYDPKAYSVEVIGNIHENPELLEGSK